MIRLQKRLITYSLISLLLMLVCLFSLLVYLVLHPQNVFRLLVIFITTGALLFISTFFFLRWGTRSISRSVSLLSEKITALSRGEQDIMFHHSDTKEMQEIVRAAEILQYEMVSREKERRQWTQDITHDLRTPITAIKSQLQAVRDGVFSLDENRYNLLFKELGIIEKMVGDFSLLSRIESPEMKLHQKWVLSGRLMDTLLHRFDPLSHERNIRLKGEVGNFYFKTDENLFLRAASNLVQNAFQYTSSGSEVKISLTIEKNQIRFIVENPGMIPEEDLPYIFQRLYRGEKSRTTTGSGLGLTIAKSIAQLHNGDIQARNSDHETSLFEMTINMTF